MDTFSFSSRTRFCNPVSGVVFTGKTFEDYVAFVNDKLTSVHIGNTSTKMNIRIVSAILGKKFLINKNELKNIDKIIMMHFIKSNKLVRSNNIIKKICQELRDISFDVNMLFLNELQGNLGYLVSPNYNSREVRIQKFASQYLNIVLIDKGCTSEDLREWTFNNMRDSEIYRLKLTITDLNSSDFYNKVEEILWEFEFTHEGPYFLSSLLDYLDYWKMLTSDDVDRMLNWTQAGCHESGGAYDIPLVAQGFFDQLSLLNLPENTKNVVDSLTESLNNVAKSGVKLSGFKEIFNSLLSSLSGGIKIKFEGLDDLLTKLDSLASFAKNIIISLLLLLLLKCLQQAGILNKVVLGIMSAFLCIAGITTVVSDCDWDFMWKHICDCFSMFKYESTIVCQAGIANTSVSIEIFMALLQSVTLGRSVYYGKDLINSFISSTRSWDKMKVDFCDNVNTWFTLVQLFMDFICEKFALKPWIVWQGKHPEVSQYVEETNQFLDDMMKDPTLSFDKGRKLEALLRNLRQALAGLPHTAVHERNVLRSVIDSLNPWKVKLGKANFLGNGPRVKPASVLFVGPSQIGKSEFMNVFLRLVATRVLPKSRLESFLLNPSTEIYNRCIEQEYWDAWNDQSFVLIDEIGARKDVVGSNNEAFEALRLINGNPFSLHAADIESKGMINARPLGVGATSNLLWFDWSSLSFPEAFENRWTAFVCVPKAEYLEDPNCDRFDFASCKMKKLDKWLYEFEHLEFWPYDLTKMRKGLNIHLALIKDKEYVAGHCAPYTAMEIRDWYIDNINNNKAHGDKMLHMHDQMIKKEVFLRADIEEVKRLLNGPDEELKRAEPMIKNQDDLFRAIDEELHRLYPQGNSGKKSKNHFAVSVFYNIVYYGAFYVMLKNLFYPTKSNLKYSKSGTPMQTYDREFVLKDEVKKAQDYMNLIMDKFNKDKRPIYIQAATEMVKKTFGCGECIVCCASLLTVEEIQIPNMGKKYWPEDAEKIREHFHSHALLDDLDYDVVTAVGANVVPWCLRLKKDIWTPDNKLIEYSNSELYAAIVRCYIENLHVELAKNSKKNLKLVILEVMNIPRVLVGRLVNNWKIVVPVIAATGTVAYTLYHYFSRLFPQSNSGRTGRLRVRQVKKKVITKNNIQSATDGVIDSIMNKVLTRCQFRIGHTGCEKPIGVITMLGKGIGFMPLHFAQILTAQYEDHGYTPCVLPVLNSDWSQRREVPFDCFKFYSLSENDISSDLIFFSADVRFIEPTPHIYKYFVRQKNFPMDRFQGALYCSRLVGKNIITMKEPTMILPNVECVYNDKDFSNDSFVLVDAFKYYLRTEVGDCGSLLVMYSHDGSPERILGMHVSGNNYGTGYSQVISYENVELAFQAIMNDRGDIDVNEVDTLESDKLPENFIQGFANLGEFKGPRNAVQTELIRSPLNNVEYECLTAPARLTSFTNSSGYRVDPIAMTRAVYQSPSRAIDNDLLDAVVSSTTNHIFNNSVVFDGLVGPRELTFEEACFGIDGHPFCNGLKRSTSPGVPMCMEKPNKFPGTKRKWLGPVNDEQDRPNDDDPDYLNFKNRVMNIVREGHKGNRLFHLARDFPKDERRKKEKVDKGLTRGISGTSADYAAACVMAFGAVCEWLMTNRIFNGMTVGVNAFGSEWNMIAKHMKMGGDDLNYLDGDFKGFDGCHTRQLLLTFLLFCDVYYGSTSKLRTILFEDLVNSIHIVNGKVYLWNKSLPSGHPLTPIINCWINLILNRAAFVKTYLRKMPKSDSNVGDALRLYDKYVITIVYGDDNAHRIDPKVQCFFNMLDHTESMFDMGYTYTDARKTGNIGEFLSYKQISFLKREFYYHDSLRTFVAPLSLDTIKDMIQWTKKKDVNFEFLKNNVTKAVLELSFHPFNVYNEHKNIIRKMSQKYLNWVPESLTYQLDACKNASRDEYL
jgi:hypothetical protein